MQAPAVTLSTICRHGTAPIGSANAEFESYITIIKQNQAIMAHFPSLHRRSTRGTTSGNAAAVEIHKMGADAISKQEVKPEMMKNLRQEAKDLIQRLADVGIPFCYACAVKNMGFSRTGLGGNKEFTLQFSTLPCRQNHPGGVNINWLRQKNLTAMNAHFEELVEVAGAAAILKFQVNRLKACEAVLENNA